MIVPAMLASPTFQAAIAEAAPPRQASVPPSAVRLAETQLPPEAMAELAQVIVLQGMQELATDRRFASATKLARDKDALAAVDRFAEAQLETQLPIIAGDRPTLLNVIAQRYAADFDEVERLRILAFLDSPDGKLFVAGGPASFQRPKITAFLASPTGKRFSEYQSALFESRDLTAWRESTAAQMRARLATAVDALAGELDRMAKDRP